MSDNNQARLIRDIEEIKTKNDKTTEENAILKQELIALRAEHQEIKWKEFRKTAKSLVVGSSILRDIENESVENTTVRSISGGKIADVKEEVRNVKKDEFANLTVLVGGNDVEETDDIAKVVNDYKDMLTVAKEKVTSITVASVLPRICPPNTTSVMDKIDSLNANLQETCQELSVAFIDNNDSFRLRDGSINDGYFLKERHSNKQVHLTDKGTTKLCEKLGIKAKPGTVITKARNHHQRQRQENNQVPVWARAAEFSRPPPPLSPRARMNSGYEPPAPQPRREPTAYQNQPQQDPQALGTRPQMSIYNNTHNDYTPAPHFTPAPHYALPVSEAPRNTDFKNHSSGDTRPTRAAAHSSNTGQFNNRCEFCNESGHSSVQCWYQKLIQCKCCKEYGHKEKHCLSAQRQQQVQQRTHNNDYVARH